MNIVMGLCGGLIFGGLLLGTATSSVGILLGYAGAGLAIAGLAELTRAAKEKKAEQRKLGIYPMYRY